MIASGPVIGQFLRNLMAWGSACSVSCSVLRVFAGLSTCSIYVLCSIFFRLKSFIFLLIGSSRWAKHKHDIIQDVTSIRFKISSRYLRKDDPFLVISILCSGVTNGFMLFNGSSKLKMINSNVSFLCQETRCHLHWLFQCLSTQVLRVNFPQK